MKTLVLLATTLAFCTMQTLADNIFQDVLEKDAGFIDEEPKKGEAKGVRKFSGWWMLDDVKFPMTLMAGLDMENGLIAGEATVDKETFSVAGTLDTNGKVTFNAVSKKEPTYTYTGMYKDGKIKGKYVIPRLAGTLLLKKTGLGSWEGTIKEGPRRPSAQYKMKDVHLNLDKNGMVTGTGEDAAGKFAFTGSMDSNNNVELSFHYLHDPTDAWTEKGKFNKKMNSFQATFLEKNFNGTFELTED